MNNLLEKFWERKRYEDPNFQITFLLGTKGRILFWGNFFGVREPESTLLHNQTLKLSKKPIIHDKSSLLEIKKAWVLRRIESQKRNDKTFRSETPFGDLSFDYGLLDLENRKQR